MGAAEHGVLLGGARAALRAPILLLRGAIIGAVDLRFSCFLVRKLSQIVKPFSVPAGLTPARRT